jgi:hypothetical protein
MVSAGIPHVRNDGFLYSIQIFKSWTKMTKDILVIRQTHFRNIYT